MTTDVAFDQAKAEAFVAKAVGDVGGQMAVVLAHIGDRLGLFDDLATNGPATDAELAKRAGINQRYAREWLGGMATAGYIDYDPSSGTFTLPSEHVAVLATEDSPVFLGGFYQALPLFLKPIDQLLEAFRKGGGVPPSAYESGYWEAMERHTARKFEQLLLQQWLPAMPDVDAKLKAGGSLADVGCGSGRALIKLADAYPRARLVGFDVSDSQLERARGNIDAAGLGDRVSVEKRDVGQGLPGQYDVITTFDVIHDSVDPLGLLAAIRKGLKPDGIYVCVDINSSSRLEENIGPRGTMLHGISLLYCMTTSLAGGGAGLGTLGFHEPKAREMCAEVGFSSVRKLPVENAFNNAYEIRA